MAAKTPIRAVKDGSGNITGFSEYQSGEFLSVAQGGTGAVTATAAKSAVVIVPFFMPSVLICVSAIYFASNASILPIASCNAATSKGTIIL